MNVDWQFQFKGARAWEDLDDIDPVRRDALIEQAVADTGYSSGELLDDLADTDDVVAVDGTDLDNPELLLASERSESGTDPDSEAPGDDTDGSDAETRAKEAFADAVRFFHHRLGNTISDHTENGEHPERPTTAREYFSARGWDEETIQDAQLGWAPARGGALLDFLHRRGYSKEEILATGLFTDDLRPLWRGRYVLPYFDESGMPVYAITRSTGKRGGGAAGYDGHPNDGMSGKYAKPAHTKPYAYVEEPIFGLDTLDRDGPVIITEGIADAISAHEAGYACISPVTTQFKKKHYGALLDALENADVDRVCVIQDSEETDADETDDGQLEFPRISPGLKGALSTAAWLTENGVDAYVGELPRNGLRKLDVDDYLQEWAGDDALGPIVRSANPPGEHPLYADVYDRKSVERGRAEESSGFDGETPESGERTQLFDLSLSAVSGRSVGSRGKNPLGHTGDSENYFLVVDDEYAYDFKRKVAFSPVLYLLVECGERRVDDPYGRIEDSELLEVWAYAKSNGYLADSDPIPRRALKHLAVSEGLCEHSDVVDEWKLPPEAYNGALDAVRDVYDVEPGRSSFDGSHGGNEYVAVLPTSESVDNAASGWNWKHAGRRQEKDGLTMDVARDRCQELLDDTVSSRTHRDGVLVEALPTLGKSSGSIRAVANTGTPVSVLTSRHDLYDQLREWCDDHGLTHYTLPSFTRDCECARGDHGAEWEQRVMEWYNSGASPGDIHKFAENVLGRPLPCQEQGECEYSSLWDFSPDEFDVLIGHYTHAYKSKVTSGRVTMFDEFPEEAYSFRLDGAELTSAVNGFLSTVPDLPFETFTDLVEWRHDPQKRSDALLWFEENGAEPDTTLALDADPVDARAPLAVFALLAAAENNLGNGYERTELPDGGVALYDREESAVRLHTPPEMDYTRNIVALDGTPTKAMWETVLGARLEHKTVLDDDERREYLANALNLNIVRTTDAVKPYSSGRYVNVEEDSRLLSAVREKHGRKPSLITSRRALDGPIGDGEGGYKEQDVLEDVDSAAYYGNLKGSNQFGSTRLGVVIGSRHYGDKYIKLWGALGDETVERGDEKGAGLTYGEYGDEILQHMRENEVLQAAMRFGRDGNGAAVYVHTSALPEWVPIAGEGRVLAAQSDGEKQVAEALAELWSASTSEVVEHPAVEISAQMVRRHLNALAERGYVRRKERGRGYKWYDSGVDDVENDRRVELPDGNDPETDAADSGAQEYPEEESAETEDDARDEHPSETYEWAFSGTDPGVSVAGTATLDREADPSPAD